MRSAICAIFVVVMIDCLGELLTGDFQRLNTSWLDAIQIAGGFICQISQVLPRRTGGYRCC